MQYFLAKESDRTTKSFLTYSSTLEPIPTSSITSTTATAVNMDAMANHENSKGTGPVTLHNSC